MQAQSQNSALSVIKTSFEGDVRRFNLTNFEFDALKTTITQLYPDLAAADFSVKFSDEDGDLITISSKAELLLALKSAHEQGQKALKLFISKSGAPAADFVEVATPPAPISVPVTPTPVPVPVPVPVTEAAKPAPASAPAVQPAAPATPTSDSKDEAKPQSEPKTESKDKDECIYKKLALAFVSDAAVQAALPELTTRVLAIVLPEGDRKDFTAQQLIDAALSFPAIKEHASVQQLLPLLPLVLPRIEATVKAVNQALAAADPAMLMLLKGFAGSLPVMVGRLAPHLPALLEQIFAHCAKAKDQGGCAFANPFKFNGEEVDIDLSGLPGLLGPLAPLFAEALGSAAPAGAAPGFPFPLPCFFRGSAAPAHGPADLAGVFDVLRGFVAGEVPQEGEAEAEEEEEAEPAAHEPGTHPNVKCDGCGVLPIKGIRFKCTRCPNYDLCEACEAKNTHPPRHPLIKIRPETVKPAAPSNVHEGVKCDGCGVEPITGVRYKCTKCPDYDLCEPCEAKNSHPADHPLIKMRHARRRGPCGFFARRFGFGPFGHHGPHHGPHGHGHPGRFGPHPGAGHPGGPGFAPRRFGGFRRFMHVMQQQNQAAEGKDGQRYQAVFVRDVTVPDRSEVNANSEHVKIWELKNTGDAAWPEGAKLIFLRGDRELSTQEEFHVPIALPGQSVECVAVIKAPAKPGRYAAYYRLADANREVLFGPRVWVDVVVKEEAKVAPAQPQAQPAPTPAPAPVEDKKEKEQAAPTNAPGASKYPAQTQVLLNMGFANTELNEYLLANNEGNVQKVAHFLLDKMYGQH